VRAASFGQLADAINTGFARWDLAHLHEFELADGRRVGYADAEDPGVEDQASVTVVETVAPGDEFRFVYDLGDAWTHACRVVETGVDPIEEAGARPPGPVAIWGWGWIPDQYHRETDDEAE